MTDDTIRPKLNISSHTIEPKDDEQWGKLVKTWATGKDYVNNGKNYPRPDTKPDPLAEFNRQTTDAGAGLELPDYVKSILIIQATKDVLVIKLPPKAMIEESEKFLANNDYTLPKFYGPVFGKPPEPGIKDPAERLRLHAMRIGDYTIRLCT
jgi:hypothetical protein